MTGPTARLAAGPAVIAILALPPVIGLLEASMVGHVAVQIPLLVATGWLIGHALGAAPMSTPVRFLQSCNAEGIAGLLLAVFGALFWMLPRSLDAALAEPAVELAKFLSLALLVGLPLGLGWHRLRGIVRGFVWANLVSMLAVLGWLYLDAPVRLCNYYLVGQQVVLGRVLLAVAAAVSVFWAGQLFFRGAGGKGARRWADIPLQE